MVLSPFSENTVFGVKVTEDVTSTCASVWLLRGCQIKVRPVGSKASPRPYSVLQVP